MYIIDEKKKGVQQNETNSKIPKHLLVPFFVVLNIREQSIPKGVDYKQNSVYDSRHC